MNLPAKTFAGRVIAGMPNCQAKIFAGSYIAILGDFSRQESCPYVWFMV
jgi:hypothetical protein